MNYDPLLKDLVKITGENYFKLKRVNFWKTYADYQQKEIDPEWFVNDTFRIPMVDLDLTTGNQFTTLYEPSLAATIKRDIRKKFSIVQVKIDRYLDRIEESTEKSNFLNRIAIELQEIGKQIKPTGNDDFYYNVIMSVFEAQTKDLLRASNIKSSHVQIDVVKNSEVDNSSIYYKYSEEDEGKAALEVFCIALNKSGLIERTRLLDLKKTFSDRPISNKVIWRAGKNEFYYFFQELKDRDFFAFENIWKAASKNFILLKKDGTLYSNRKMKGAGKLKNATKRIRIDALIELLELYR